MATPHRCPVCEGRGVVAIGFYVGYGAFSTAADPEKCRSCWGSGIVWEHGPKPEGGDDGES